MRTASKRQILAVILVAACVLMVVMLAFPARCPICGGRIVKMGTVTDDTNLPSRNLCIWNRSICANPFYGPDSAICTRCWHAHRALTGNWERACESPASFQKPLSSAIQGVPLPPADAIRSRVVFTQTYDKKRFTESVAFWCVGDESLLARLRSYCTATQLTFHVESNRIAGEVFITIE
jgi:hypothetical protein